MEAATLLHWASVVLSGAVTIILIPIALYLVKYGWDRRRWHKFKELIREWAREESFSDNLTDEEWNALVATELTEARFEPTRIKELIQLAVWFAMGCASLEVRGRIQFSGKGPDNEEPD